MKMSNILKHFSREHFFIYLACLHLSVSIDTFGYTVCHSRRNLNTVIGVTSARSRIGCADHCSTTEACSVANFRKATGGNACELIQGPLFNGNCEDLTSESDSAALIKRPNCVPGNGYLNLDTNKCVCFGDFYGVLCELECPSPLGYTLDVGTSVCYRIDATPKLWPDAQNECLNEGAHLLRISTLQIWTMIEAEVSKPLYSNVAIFSVDGTEQGHPGLWLNSDGEEMTWVKWNPGQPSDPAQECMIIYSGMSWNVNDGRCHTYSYSFICEMN